MNEQHCFRKGRSTITNLCIFKQNIIDSFNNGAQTDVIYTEMERTFDKIDYDLLIIKLKGYGFKYPYELV